MLGDDLSHGAKDDDVGKSTAKAEEAAAREAAREAEAAEAAAKEEVKLAEADSVGVVAGSGGGATGSGGGATSLIPAGATPIQGGLGSIDGRLLPAHLGAAVMMFDQYHESLDSIPEPEAAPTGILSGSLVRGLAPVSPPVLMGVVASPFVVFEALIDAMAASGQALVIPFLAGAAGFFAPGLRRKNLLAEVLGPLPDSDSQNACRWVGELMDPRDVNSDCDSLETRR